MIPSRSLGSYQDNEPNRIDVRHSTFTHEQDEELWKQKDYVDSDLQVNAQCRD